MITIEKYEKLMAEDQAARIIELLGTIQQILGLIWFTLILTWVFSKK